MNIPRLRPRALGALAVTATIAGLAAAPAADAASTTKYTTAGYLQRELGLPTTDATPAIEPITFDRFQWLLRQEGRLAILIGDPATDTTFRARAQDTEAAAKAAGVKTVYWFNPNLSGNAVVGGTVEPNLDIRKPAGITALAPESRTIYGKAWSALVGESLGNGLKITRNQSDTKNATVDVADDASISHDAGGTEVDQKPGALFDYSGGAAAAPTDVQDSFFLVYDKDAKSQGKEARIRAWTNLSDQPSTAAAKEDVTKAIDVVGGTNLVTISEFSWWKHEANAKHLAQTTQVSQGRDVPVLGDADAQAGWRVKQITYPQLVDLLKNVRSDESAALLFGGTWCPNTRPVLPATNDNAAKNDATVYNFDTVLDGGLVGGTTTSAVNPLQTRNTQDYTPRNSPKIERANPSFLYGDLVNTYLKNIKTEYGTDVTYFPGGRADATQTSARKLQVPFVLGYRGSASGDGVKRQWIIDKGDGGYAEYMSQWYLTKPQINQLGLATAIPLDAPIWGKINAQVQSLTWRTDPATLYPNTATEADDDQYLVAADTAKVTYTPAAGTTPASVSAASGGSIVISPQALSAALAGLGSPAPANVSAAKAALIAAETATPRDETRLAQLRTIVGAWNVAQTRKSTLLARWGVATDPNTVVGGIAAVHALDVFFSGLPDGLPSRRTLTAETVAAGTAPKVTVAIADDYGFAPTGALSLVVKKDGAVVATTSASVSGGSATFTLPTLEAGTYDYAASYAGDDQLAAFTDTGRLTVSPVPDGPTTPIVTPDPTPNVTLPTPPAPAPGPGPSGPGKTIVLPKVSKVKGAVVKAPTQRKGGTYKVTISVPKGASAVAGKVTVKLKKGAITKTLTGRLSRGVVTVSVPKLAKGTWKVTINWPGDARFASASASGGAIKVTK